MENLLIVWEWIRGGLVFMAVLTVLVFVHELGHYWFARLFGMHVEAFAVMMGGVRKTDLREVLPRPLGPTWPLWLTTAASLALIWAGTFERQTWALYSGMAILGILLPILVARRIATLYHLPNEYLIGVFGKSFAVALVIVTIATQFRPTLLPILSTLLAASLVSLIIVYYYPVSNKPDDAQFGQGSIQLASGQAFPVRFRPVIHTTDKRGTEFSLLLLPLGGFAKIKGMHPREDGSEVNIPEGFYSKAPWKRLVVLFAGPAFSILFGILLLALVGMGEGAPRASNIVSNMTKTSPAAKAGLKIGDTVVAVNGQPVTQGFDVVRQVRFSYETTDSARTARPVQLQWVRDGERFSASITPMLNDRPTYLQTENGILLRREYQAILGITFETGMQKLPPDQAVVRAVMQPVQMVANLVNIFTNVDTARENLGGMTGVAAASKEVARSGFWTVLTLAGLLSISLGVMNLLPVPPMDGGQMVIAFVEMLRRGRRLPLSVQSAVTNFGMVFILLFALLGFALDINRLTGHKAPNSGFQTLSEDQMVKQPNSPGGSAPGR